MSFRQTSVRSTSRKPKRLRWIFLAILIVGLGWLGFDFYGPRKHSLRDFDPNEVARLETDMWRSYYAKQRLKLFNQLAELMRSQYGMPFATSNTVAYQAAQAAFVFKEGKKREDYEKALPNLVKFYQAIYDGADVDFDVQKAAKLELEWWIIHRQRDKFKPGDLDRALAELPAEIYRVPVERLMEHARLRQEAMTIRDKRAEDGGVTEADWKRIHELLQASWKSLFDAVKVP
ncbi:MAG: hypothetical protein KA368_02665 [Acidobacteria bacterium]|nr:hypothetical protein [Acidobacteriota bacterium]